MPAVSREEYLHHATGEDVAEGHAGQLDRHAEEPAERPEPPRPRLARPFAAPRFAASYRRPGPVTHRPDRSEEGGQVRQPEQGHRRGVPPPKPVLPGSHHYPVPGDVPDGPVLDVGPAKPYYSGGMAHGVPAEVHHGGRPAPASGQQLAARARAETEEAAGTSPDPVPVYLVDEPGSGTRPLTKPALRTVAIATAGADPQVLIPRNPRRKTVKVLNESATVAVRITYDLTLSGGALLPAGMTSYLEIPAQEEVCAYCPTGGPAQVSVVDVYDVVKGT